MRTDGIAFSTPHFLPAASPERTERTLPDRAGEEYLRSMPFAPGSQDSLTLSETNGPPQDADDPHVQERSYVDSGTRHSKATFFK